MEKEGTNGKNPAVFYPLMNLFLNTEILTSKINGSIIGIPAVTFVGGREK
jgi:hypothetical protein